MATFNWFYIGQQLVLLALFIAGMVAAFRFTGAARGLLASAFALFIVSGLVSLVLNTQIGRVPPSTLGVLFSVPSILTLVAWGLLVGGIFAAAQRRSDGPPLPPWYGPDGRQ